jgi:N6-adenosine-specific RNA methylase IME4
MKYSVILADPPWRYQNERSGLDGLAVKRYPCMDDKEICDLPITEFAEDNCALFMWITAPILTEGRHLPIFSAWGFRPVTVAFVWNKFYPNQMPYCGLGFYTRSGCEYCLLGIKGSVKRKSKSVRQVVNGTVTRHSKKPDIFYDFIEDLFAGPYLELFARSAHDGWKAMGNQKQNHAQLSFEDLR